MLSLANVSYVKENSLDYLALIQITGKFRK